MSKANMQLLEQLIRFSDRYELSIQFWPDQTAVYISKDGVELISYGGDFDFTIGAAISYLQRINKPFKFPNPKP